MALRKTFESADGRVLQITKLPLRKQLRRQWDVQLMVIPWIIWLIIFCYVPMYGIVIAFKDYDISKPIFDSAWVGLKYFREFFNSPSFGNIMLNTLGISILKLVFCMPAPLILAILLNEVRGVRFKKLVQSVSYLPHFLSWIIVSGIIFELTSTEGMINSFLAIFGHKNPINYLSDPKYFWAILIVSEMWKGVGWGSIIYLAAINGIDPNLYEAASIDGSNRFRNIIHITLPSLVPTIIIILMFTLGGLLNSNFDQIFMLTNAQVYDRAVVIDTYVYEAMKNGRFSFSTAVGLFKSVVGFVLLMIANTAAKIISKGEQGII